MEKPLSSKYFESHNLQLFKNQCYAEYLFNVDWAFQK